MNPRMSVVVDKRESNVVGGHEWPIARCGRAARRYGPTGIVSRAATSARDARRGGRADAVPRIAAPEGSQKPGGRPRRPIRRGRRASPPVPRVDPGPTVTGTMSRSARRQRRPGPPCSSLDARRRQSGDRPDSLHRRFPHGYPSVPAALWTTVQTAHRHPPCGGAWSRRSTKLPSHCSEKRTPIPRETNVARGIKSGPACSRRRRQRHRHMATGLSFAVRLGILLDSSGPSMGDVIAAVTHDDQFHSQPRIKIISFPSIAGGTPTTGLDRDLSYRYHDMLTRPR